MALVIAIGGRAGTGKTTLAYALKEKAPELKDALVVDDDEVRRELLGVDWKQELPHEAHIGAAQERTVEEMFRRMAEAVTQGKPAINAAGFFHEDSRQAVETFAKNIGAEFVGLWLTAPDKELLERLAKRKQERERFETLRPELGHASDADDTVLKRYGDIGLPKSPRWKIIDASISRENTLQQALTILRQPGFKKSLGNGAQP